MRIVYLDIIRALAVIFIVFTHCWSQPVGNSQYSAAAGRFLTGEYGFLIWQSVHFWTRMGVPWFAMLTGALMLERSYPDISLILKQKLPKFIAGTLAAACFYGVFVHFLFGADLTGNLANIAMGTPIGAYHLWYMYMLIGLYISIPFLARMFSAMESREVALLILLSIALVLIPATLAADKFGFAYLNSYSFIIQIWALYAITGYWLHHHNGLANIPLWGRWLALGAVMALFFWVKQDKVFSRLPPEHWDNISTYDSLYVYCSSVLMFSILRDIFARKQTLNPALLLIAAASYSIYLWHLIAVHTVNYLFVPWGLNPFAAVFIMLFFGLAAGHYPLSAAARHQAELAGEIAPPAASAAKQRE